MSLTTIPPQSARADRRRWALALLAMAEYVVVLDASIVNIALPSIGRGLRFSLANLSWVVNAYVLTFGGFLLLGGRIADLLGRRRVFVIGLVLFVLASMAGGLVWFAQVPVHGAYIANLLGPSLLVALGLGLAFVPITILSVAGVNDREYGLASGLVNTAQQIGGALGLAVLATIATSRTNHLLASRHPLDQALTSGFHSAFLAAGGFVLLAIVAAATIGTRRVKRPAPAPRPTASPKPETPRPRPAGGPP